MKKILVVGSGGAGKSTFSKALGEALGLPVIHLDALYWQAGWVEPAKAGWAAQVAGLLEADAWIMDGNYSGTLEARLRHCDTVIFLDMPALLCLWRAFSRGLRYYGQVRPDMAAGCPEQLPSPTFLRWIWNYPQRSRPKVLALLQEHGRDKTVTRLRSAQEVDNFLSELRRGTRTS